MDKSKEAYMLNVAYDGQAVIDEAIGNLIGETVCVSYTTNGRFATPFGSPTRNEKLGDRANFEPQISVQGELEGSKESGRYRVFIDDNNYSYFYAESIWSIGQDVGKRAIIFID